jgi:hypothetical protein
MTIYAAIEAAFAASSLERTDFNRTRFQEGWSSALNAYVGGPSRGEAWDVGRRAGKAYYLKVSAMERASA